MGQFKIFRCFATTVFLVANLASAISALAQANSTAKPEQHYDEIYDENGSVRTQYVGVLDAVNAMSPAQQQKFLERSRLKFSGDNKLDPMPRVIPAEEYDRDIVRGVDQRARALMAFLKDHYSGKKSYKSFVSEAVIDRIIARNGELGFQGLVDPDTIAFPYGPDIIRDAQGAWRVIEDNPGFIGGPGDLRLAQKFSLENVPGLREHVAPRDPEEFYKKLAASYKERARAHGGKAIFLMSPYKSDGEDKRTRQIMADYGIETVFPREGNDLSLLIKPDGVYVYKKSLGENSAEKVGFLALLGEHAWFDPSNPAAFERLVFEEAKELLAHKDTQTDVVPRKLRLELTALMLEPRSEQQVKAMYDSIRRLYPRSILAKALSVASPYRGLMDVVLAGKVGVNYTPGAEFIGDKELYVYVERFVRHYLNEQPILKNIETRKFAGLDGKLDRAVFDEAFDHLSRYVIKKVDGRGGNAVWVGPKIKNPATVAEVRTLIEADPGSFIVQKYTPLSMLRSMIVDMRVITDVYSHLKKIFVNVANAPWGRGLPADGNGKVNLSDEGREITILIDQGPRARACRQLFSPAK
jgi:uncharacterized circularly permuted ATP-grasp superfamily protein